VPPLLGSSSALTPNQEEQAGTLADRLAAAELQLLALGVPESSLVASGDMSAPDPTRPLDPLATVLALVAAVVVLG